MWTAGAGDSIARGEPKIAAALAVSRDLD